MPVNSLPNLDHNILCFKLLPFLRAKDLHSWSQVNSTNFANFIKYLTDGLGLTLSKDSLAYRHKPYAVLPDIALKDEVVSLGEHLTRQWSAPLVARKGKSPCLLVNLQQNQYMDVPKTLAENLLAAAIGAWASKRNHQQRRFFADIRGTLAGQDLQILSKTFRMLNIYWPARLTILGDGKVWQPDWRGLQTFTTKSDWQGIGTVNADWKHSNLILEKVLLREKDFVQLLQLKDLDNLFLNNCCLIPEKGSAAKQIIFLGKHILNRVKRGNVFPRIYFNFSKSDLAYEPDLGYVFTREVDGKQYICSFYQSFKQPLPADYRSFKQSLSVDLFNDDQEYGADSDRFKIYLQGVPLTDLDPNMSIKISSIRLKEQQESDLLVNIPPFFPLPRQIMQAIDFAEAKSKLIFGEKELRFLQNTGGEGKPPQDSSLARLLNFLESLILAREPLAVSQLREFNHQMEVLNVEAAYILEFLTDGLNTLQGWTFIAELMSYANSLPVLPLTIEERATIKQAVSKHIALNLPEDLWPSALERLEAVGQKLGAIAKVTSEPTGTLSESSHAAAVIKSLEQLSRELRLERVQEFIEQIKARLNDFNEAAEQQLKPYLTALAAPLLARRQQAELLAYLKPTDTLEQVWAFFAKATDDLLRGCPYETWLLQELLSMEIIAQTLSLGRSRSKTRVVVDTLKKHVEDSLTSEVRSSSAVLPWTILWFKCCVNERTPVSEIPRLFAVISEQVGLLVREESMVAKRELLLQAVGFCLLCLQSREDIFNAELVREFFQAFLPRLLNEPDMLFFAKWLGIMLAHRGLTCQELKNFMQDLSRITNSIGRDTEERISKLVAEQSLLTKFKSIYGRELLSFLSFDVKEQMVVFFGSYLMSAKKKNDSYVLPQEYSHLAQVMFACREKLYHPVLGAEKEGKKPELHYNVNYLQELAHNFARRGSEYLTAKVTLVESLR